MATFQRHTDEKSQSGALGIVQGIEGMRVDGDKLEISLVEPSDDLPYLLTDYHLVV